MTSNPPAETVRVYEISVCGKCRAFLGYPGWARNCPTCRWGPITLRVGSLDDGAEETMNLRDHATWEKVAEAIGHHPYEYDMSDTSERLDVVQIVLTTLDRVIADEPGSAATSWTERT